MTITAADVVERYPGTGSTDFWGISFAFSGFDQQAMPGEALERELALMRAGWASFDDVRSHKIEHSSRKILRCFLGEIVPHPGYQLSG